MDTIVLSDLIGVSDPGRAAIRALTNSKPAGILPSSSDFSAGHRPPKLNYEKSKFESSNPNPSPGRDDSTSQSNRDPNTKMKEFKERLKLSKSVAGPGKVKSTGLFSFGDLKVKGNEHLHGVNLSSKSSIIGSQKERPKVNIVLRKKNKTEVLDVDIHQRINKAFQSIESLGKDYSIFDKTLKSATERAVADGRLNRKLILPNLLKSRDAVDVNPSRIKTKKPMGEIDVTRPINKMFGLDASKVLQSSGSGGETEDSDFGAATNVMKKISLSGIPRKSRTRSYKNSAALRSPSPEIAVIRDKRFLARHEKQGSVLNKDIAAIKNQVEVMNKRSDREIRKANVELKKLNFQRPSNFTRLMAYNPNKGTGRELTDFLQSNGGICGGWDPDDHNTFLKTYRKWKNRPSRIIVLVKKEIGDKRVEEIAEHISWYEKYETLNKANKTFIRQWQIAKRREKEEIYRIAKEEQMAKLEADKRKHDIIRAQREEERERNRMRLDEWKSSIALEKKMMRINTDLIREPDNESRIGKLQEAMENIKKGFSILQPKHPEVRKFLTSKKSLSIAKQDSSPAPMSAGTSSGIFSDPGDDQSEFNGFSIDLSRGLESTEATTEGQRYGVQKMPSIESNLLVQEIRKPSSKTIRKIYQSRDAEMVETRRQAIKAKLEEKRNKLLLTAAELKDRIKKIDVPSKVMRPTKGWTIHQDAKDAEKLEATSHQIKLKEKINQHNETRVPTREMFQPGSSIGLVSKLGTPGWRK